MKLDRCQQVRAAQEQLSHFSNCTLPELHTKA